MGWLILWLDLMCALPEMTKVDICCHESLQKKLTKLFFISIKCLTALWINAHRGQFKVKIISSEFPVHITQWCSHHELPMEIKCCSKVNEGSSGVRNTLLSYLVSWLEKRSTFFPQGKRLWDYKIHTSWRRRCRREAGFRSSPFCVEHFKVSFCWHLIRKILHLNASVISLQKPFLRRWQRCTNEENTVVISYQTTFCGPFKLENMCTT